MRLFAEGVPPLKELPEELLVTLRTGGENDLPTRQLARHVRSVAEKYVPGLKVEVIYRRDRYLRGGDPVQPLLITICSHSGFGDLSYRLLRVQIVGICARDGGRAVVSAGPCVGGPQIVQCGRVGRRHRLEQGAPKH